MFAERARSSQDQGKRRGFNASSAAPATSTCNLTRGTRRRPPELGQTAHRPPDPRPRSADPARLGVENFVTTRPAAPAGPGSGRAPAPARGENKQPALQQNSIFTGPASCTPYMLRAYSTTCAVRGGPELIARLGGVREARGGTGRQEDTSISDVGRSPMARTLRPALQVRRRNSSRTAARQR